MVAVVVVVVEVVVLVPGLATTTILGKCLLANAVDMIVVVVDGGSVEALVM